MSKKYSGLDQFSKYRDGKKRRQKLWKDIEKMGRKKPASHKKRKHTSNQSKKNSNNESITFEDIMYVAPIFLALWIWIAYGFVTLLIIVSVVLIIWGIYKYQKRVDTQEPVSLNEKELKYLRSLLDDISRHQEVINKSSDVQSVKIHLDALLNVIDIIRSYPEEELNQADMTKSTLLEQKQFVLDNYDVVLEQARQRANEEIAENLRDKVEEKIPVNNTLDKTEEDISLEDVLKEAIVSKQGLYPHEILMLEYAHTYKTNNNSFQGFWKYKYYVEKPQEVLDSLYQRGFIEIGDIKTVIENMKVADIKKELEEIKISTTGKKADLIERLLSTADNEQLSNKYKERYFVLTSKGKKEIEENPYIIYLHKHPHMSVWEMNKLLYNENSNHLGYRDILWREFNQSGLLHYQCGDFGLYRNTRLSMYEFLMEENEYRKALQHLAEVVLYDLSGLDNGFPQGVDEVTKKNMLRDSLKYYFPYKDSLLQLPPGIVGYLATLQSMLKLSDVEYKEELLQNFNKFDLPQRIFTNEECVEIVLLEIGNHPRKLNTLYKEVEERIKQNLCLQ